MIRRFTVLTLALIAACVAIPESDPCAGPVQKPALIGGRPAVPADWPASVYISIGGGRCSATLIGYRTLLTAAHCVKDGGQVLFSINPNRYNAKCKHHPDYAKDKTADWALCLVSREVPGVPLETVLTDPAGLKRNQTILLTGYGCTEGPKGTGGNDGVFRIGEAKVSRLPSASHDVTLNTGAALCFGDSGGAGYVYSGNQRRIFGVNSRGNISTTSYLSATFTGGFGGWALKWAEANKVAICGLSPNAAGCRVQSSPVPPPPPKPTPTPDPCKKTEASLPIPDTMIKSGT